MATIKSFVGSKLLIKIAHPDTPTAFLHYCTVNADRGISISASFIEDTEIDCDDATLVAWIAREKESVSVSVNGGGKVNTPDIQFFYDWITAQESYPCQIVVDVPAVDGGVTFEGDFHLSQFDITAAGRRPKSDGAVAMLSDGQITCTANAA